MAIDEHSVKHTIAINNEAHEIWISNLMHISDEIHGNDPIVYQKIIDTIADSIRKGCIVRDLAMNLYNGYDSDTCLIKKAKLPPYLENLRMLSLEDHESVKEEKQKLMEKALTKADKIYSGPLKASYLNLIKECSRNKPTLKKIEKATWIAIQERTRYNAMRLARTEFQRAWFYGQIARYQTDRFVFGFCWQLSSRHKYVSFDLCDVCVNMDVGFGRGVFYKNCIPIAPLHPNCMCMIDPVFITDIEKGSRFQPELATEYIKSLTYKQKINLFKTEGLEKYNNGVDWQDCLNGWSGFQSPYSILRKFGYSLN